MLKADQRVKQGCLANYRHRLVFGVMNSPIQYKRAVPSINPRAMQSHVSLTEGYALMSEMAGGPFKPLLA
jgi:hypothetical protein